MRLLGDGRSALLTAAAECRVRDIRLFGSVARGEQQRGSDVDLLVFHIDIQRVLEIVEHDLPPLEEAIIRLLADSDH